MCWEERTCFGLPWFPVPFWVSPPKLTSSVTHCKHKTTAYMRTLFHEHRWICPGLHGGSGPSSETKPPSIVLLCPPRGPAPPSCAQEGGQRAGGMPPPFKDPSQDQHGTLLLTSRASSQPNGHTYLQAQLHNIVLILDGGAPSYNLGAALRSRKWEMRSKQSLASLSVAFTLKTTVLVHIL